MCFLPHRTATCCHCPTGNQSDTAKSKMLSIYLSLESALETCYPHMLPSNGTFCFTSHGSLPLTLECSYGHLSSLASLAMLPHPEALPPVYDKDPFSIAIIPWCICVTILWTAFLFHCTSLTRHELLKKNFCLCLVLVSPEPRTCRCSIRAQWWVSSLDASGKPLRFLAFLFTAQESETTCVYLSYEYVLHTK